MKLLEKFVQSLRDEDAQSAHGNQKLFLDDVFIVYLLSFFNPSIKSLRLIEDFSQTRQGMQLSLYVAIIGIMLMYLHTGFRPSKYLSRFTQSPLACR